MLSGVVENILNLFSKYRTKIPKSLEVPLASLDVYRQYHLEIILQSIDGISLGDLEEPEQRHWRGVNLDCMVGYSDLLMIHPQLHESKLSG